MSELLNFLTTHEDQFRKNRLAALYSDFRHLRTTNPDGYTANVKAWQKGLTEAAKGGHIASRGTTNDLLILNIDENLLRALETKEWGRPLALGTIVRDAVYEKEMMPLDEFLAAKQSIYRSSWAPKPWDLLSWSLRQLGLAGGLDNEDRLPVGRLVILSNVESATKEFARQANAFTSRNDRIYSKKLFQKAFANMIKSSDKRMTGDDIHVLLTYMARDKNMIAYDGQTIKIRGLAETEPLKITSEDSTIASLKTLVDDLQTQINGLNLQIENLSCTSRDAIARKNRTSALAALRSKKLVETNLSRQSATLFQLEEVYAKIGQAADQVEVVRILEGSTGVLKAFNAEVGGLGKVDDVLYDLKNQMTQVEEVGNALVEAGKEPVDEDEVDAELEAIELEYRKKNKEVASVEIEDKERLEVAETKRKLELLDVTERQATRGQEANIRNGLNMGESIDNEVNSTAVKMGQMSLDGERSAELVT